MAACVRCVRKMLMRSGADEGENKERRYRSVVQGREFSGRSRRSEEGERRTKNRKKGLFEPKE